AADVLQVTQEDAGAALGWGGAGVRFATTTAAERATIDTILAAARGTELMTAAAPPRRADPRYPIEWPALISGKHGLGEFVIVDVSRHGVFVAADKLPGDLEVNLALAPTLENGGKPIEATALTVRAVGDQVAAQRGISAGF